MYPGQQYKQEKDKNKTNNNNQGYLRKQNQNYPLQGNNQGGYNSTPGGMTMPGDYDMANNISSFQQGGYQGNTGSGYNNGPNYSNSQNSSIQGNSYGFGGMPSGNNPAYMPNVPPPGTNYDQWVPTGNNYNQGSPQSNNQNNEPPQSNYQNNAPPQSNYQNNPLPYDNFNQPGPPGGSNQSYGAYQTGPSQHNNAPPNQMAAPQGQPLPPNTHNISKGQLRGCINDVKNIKSFIIFKYGFNEREMVILTDDQTQPDFIPTKANILKAMKWLVEGAKPNDSLFFHYSGHGGQAVDEDGDEDDGTDETILPVDYEKAGIILDDQMNQIMVQPLKPGTRLTAIFDSCHSGTALDLPYVYGTDGKLKKFNPVKKVFSELGKEGKKFLAGGSGDLMKSFGAITSGLSMFGKGKKAEKITTETRTSLADVIMFSGCKDVQTSADAHISGVGHTGAMSHALITCLSKNPYNYQYHQLLLDLRDFLKGKYSQLPVLSSGRPMDINSNFSM